MVDYDMPLGLLGGIIDKVKLKKVAERGMENGLYRVKALLEGTGSIPVYITLDAYRHILKEKERLNCSVSDAIVRIIQEQEKLSETQEQNGHVTGTQTQTQVAEASH
jgi:predicted CopG family antitoxin